MEREEQLPKGARLVIWTCKATTFAALALVAAGILQDAWRRHHDEILAREQARRQAIEWNAAVKRWKETAPERARLNAEYERCIREAREARIGR